MASARSRLYLRVAADAYLKAEVEALRVAILAAARAGRRHRSDAAADRLAAFERARIAEVEMARWRASVAALHAALEARGLVERQVVEGITQSASAGGPIDG